MALRPYHAFLTRAIAVGPKTAIHRLTTAGRVAGAALWPAHRGRCSELGGSIADPRHTRTPFVSTAAAMNTGDPVREERRRIARELHDGLAQELAYIAIESKRLAAVHDRHELDSIAGAAQRALQETRRAIEALTGSGKEPLDERIANEAETVATRWGADVELSVDPTIVPSSETQDALVRVVREAITNATRHGDARRVWIKLESTDGITLRVIDNGSGFDPRRPRNGGFGLRSMRERVERLGGGLRVESLPGAGTMVEAFVP